MKRIYLLGSLNIDLTIRAPRMPKAGETLKGSDFLLTPGGKGANQAYAAAALGGEVYMAGAVGKDAFADILLESLMKAGADTQFIRRTERHTGVAVITLSEGDNRIVMGEGANDDVDCSDVDALLADAWAGDIFAVQLETPLPVVRYALKEAKLRGLYTVFNPAPAQAGLEKLMPDCDLVVPNENELEAITGEQNIDMGCEKLLLLGAGGVLVTLGEKGAYLKTKAVQASIEATKFGEAVDTTAAGDTFCGALCVRLAEGASLEEAARFASLCAGIAVTRRGAQVSIPFREEADRFQKI